MRLSFRAEGLLLLLTNLNNALTAHTWTQVTPTSSSSSSSSTFTSTVPAKRGFSTSSAGVGGLIRDVDASTRRTDRALDTAFTDLTALMQHAHSVVQLAQRFSHTLAQSPASSEEEAAFTSLLTSMGLPNPVTRHSTPSSSFHVLLSRQLSDFIAAHPRFLSQGMLTLTDVFCLYNRARGTDLISPTDCLKACELMGGEGGAGGMKVVELGSGVRVVCREGMVERGLEEVRRVVSEGRGVTVLEASGLLGVSVLLVEGALPTRGAERLDRARRQR